MRYRARANVGQNRRPLNPLNMYNVFVDFHHASLLNSFIMLFENRLGGNVYRPIGMEWAREGFWAIYDHPATQAQFLSMEQGYRPIDGSPALNIVGEVQNDVYYCQDIDSGKYNKAITLETFLKLDIDLIIATIPQHIEPFVRLAALHPKKPKVIYQIGNSWNLPTNTPIRNVMASARLPYKPDGFNIVEYHQEFDTGVFHPGGVENLPNNIYSFVNCFNVDGLFAADWSLFQQVEAKMTEWNFKCYGGQCRDGAAHGTQQLADKMREAKFIWHTKFAGDGYGHVLHNAAAVGRPLITRKAYYYDKLGGDLMIDGETAILIDGLNPDQIADKIRYYSDWFRYGVLCGNMREKFKNVVNFDGEFENIKHFLSKLL